MRNIQNRQMSADFESLCEDIRHAVERDGANTVLAALIKVLGDQGNRAQPGPWRAYSNTAISVLTAAGANMPAEPYGQRP